MSHWHFEAPWALLLLLALPLLPLWRRRKFLAPAMHLPLLAYLRPYRGWRARLSWWLTDGLKIFGLILGIVALARPQSGTTEVERLTEGVDILLAIDASGSMQALDFKMNGKPVDRLSVIKQVAADFIDSRQNDRLGLVVFGDQAFTQCPLTLDHRIVKQFLEWSEIGMAGKATAIGDALAVAIKRLEKAPAKSKVIILLTDGTSNAGNVQPQEAAQIAKALGIKIYTIGVGSHGPVPFPVQDIFGSRIVQQEMEIDEEALQQIAATTDGLYFNATNTEALRAIYAQIDGLERTEVKTKSLHHYQDQFYPWLLAAALAFGFALVSEQSWLRRLP